MSPLALFYSYFYVPFANNYAPPVTYLEFRLKVYKLCTEKFYKTKMPAHCTKKKQHFFVAIFQ